MMFPFESFVVVQLGALWYENCLAGITIACLRAPHAFFANVWMFVILLCCAIPCFLATKKSNMYNVLYLWTKKAILKGGTYIRWLSGQELRIDESGMNGSFVIV